MYIRHFLTQPTNIGGEKMPKNSARSRARNNNCSARNSARAKSNSRARSNSNSSSARNNSNSNSNSSRARGNSNSSSNSDSDEHAASYSGSMKTEMASELGINFDSDYSSKQRAGFGGKVAKRLSLFANQRTNRK